MTIRVDPRAGSGSAGNSKSRNNHLLHYLREIGAPCEEELLSAGDVAFIGRGPEERPVNVGIEYKTLSDLLSCIVSGRFSEHQLPGMRAAYDRGWLLIEGVWKPGPAGELLVHNWGKWTPCPWTKRTWKQADLDKWLTTIEVIGGLHIARTSSKQESAQWVRSLYSWWTAKAFEDHDAHNHRMAPPVDMSGRYVAPNLVEMWAACLPGVGPKRARSVGEHFGSAWALANAEESDWSGVAGVGPKTVAKAIDAIREVK